MLKRENRVTCVKWHPTLAGVAAMSVTANASHEDYLEQLSTRLAMPTVVMIWSMGHPFFPQLLLRAPEVYFFIASTL